MKNFGEKVKELRISHGMSGNELATKLGRGGNSKKQYVYDLESGKIKKFDLGLINKLMDVFDVSMDYFMENDTVEGKAESNDLFVRNDIESEKYWKLKYYESIKEISQLKTKIIMLLENRSN